jgi:hypothetical protein
MWINVERTQNTLLKQKHFLGVTRILVVVAPQVEDAVDNQEAKLINRGMMHPLGLACSLFMVENQLSLEGTVSQLKG